MFASAQYCMSDCTKLSSSFIGQLQYNNESYRHTYVTIHQAYQRQETMHYGHGKRCNLLILDHKKYYVFSLTCLTRLRLSPQITNPSCLTTNDPETIVKNDVDDKLVFQGDEQPSLQSSLPLRASVSSLLHFRLSSQRIRLVASFRSAPPHRLSETDEPPDQGKRSPLDRGDTGCYKGAGVRRRAVQLGKDGSLSRSTQVHVEQLWRCQIVHAAIESDGFEFDSRNPEFRLT